MKRPSECVSLDLPPVGSSLTEELRNFWGMPTLEDARDKRVQTIPGGGIGIWDEGLLKQDALIALQGLLWKPEERVLDLGVGIGRTTKQLALLGLRVYAVDVSPAMLDYAQSYCAGVDGIDLVLSDGYGCGSVPSNSCDYVLSYYVLQHMPSWDMIYKNFQDLHRVAKNGSFLRLQSSVSSSGSGVIGFDGIKQSPLDYFLLGNYFGWNLVGYFWISSDFYVITWQVDK